MPESSLGKKQAVPAGVVILSEGEQQTCAYRILSGRVEVFKTLEGARVVLARLGPGQFFGEMNLVLESSRTASVVALEPCVLRVITQDTFNRLLRRDPKSVLPLLRVLFERLRMMNIKYLQALAPEAAAAAPLPPPPASATCVLTASEPGVMERVLGAKGKEVRQFPFRIGRKSSSVSDAFTLNDLYIPDVSPYQVSRNHCEIDVGPDKVFRVQDRGSRLGTLVNGERVGGQTGRIDKALKPGKNTVVLGGAASPYRFTVELK